MGIFYIESPATRQLLAKAQIVDFKHIVIFSSIIRPAANRFINLILERIHGKQWTSIHPDLDFLNESYGVMVYEEQVSMTAMIMAGLGYSDADKLRKTISRNSDNEKINLWKKIFFNRSIKRGYNKNVIDIVWNMMASFIGFSFCKPHSASYAMLSFTCAYLKAHYTAEFIAAVISNEGGYYSAYAYLSEARRFGVLIKTPDINHSYYEWRGHNNEIRMGFKSIRKLKKQTIRKILDERKTGNFISLDDFLFRVDLDLSDAMALTNAQCFSELCTNRAHREIALIVAEYYLRDGQKGSPLAYGPITTELSDNEKYKIELGVFGYPINFHPLSIYRELISSRVSYAKDIPKYIGRSIYLIGVYITCKEIRTKAKESMQFLTLEDETDIYECIMFPKVFLEFGDIINWENLFILRGKVESSFGVCSINVTKISSLTEWIKKTSSVSLV